MNIKERFLKNKNTDRQGFLDIKKRKETVKMQSEYVNGYRNKIS